MAMTKCKECGNEISTKADACPKCGAKQVRTSGCAQVALIFLCLMLLFAVIGRCTRDDAVAPVEAPSTVAADVSSSTSVPSDAITPVLPQPGSQWQYTQDTDPMADGVTYTALVVSSNTVSFDFPYQGAQHGRLMLRDHPRFGKNVILSIERGQILCRSYDGCTILVRFDDGKAQRFSAAGAADNSTETIFVSNYSRFLAAMKKAKKVRIAVEVYQEGSPVFEFDVSGFAEDRFRPSN